MTDEQKGKNGNFNSPPKSGRFTKGRSENPRGRPRKKAVDHELPLGARLLTRDAILKEAGRLITATDASGSEKLEVRQALFRALVSHGLRGGVWALVQALNFSMAEDERETERKLKNFELSKQYCEQEWFNLALAAAKSEPVPEPIPHPSDFIFDHETVTVTIDGPIDEEGLAAVKAVAKLQDLAYEMSIYLDEIGAVQVKPGQKITDLGIFFACYLEANRLLPKRFKKPPAAYDEPIKKMMYLGIKDWGESLKARCREMRLPFYKRSLNGKHRTLKLSSPGIVFSKRASPTPEHPRRGNSPPT